MFSEHLRKGGQVRIGSTRVFVFLTKLYRILSGLEGFNFPSNRLHVAFACWNSPRFGRPFHHGASEDGIEECGGPSHFQLGFYNPLEGAVAIPIKRVAIQFEGLRFGAPCIAPRDQAAPSSCCACCLRAVNAIKSAFYGLACHLSLCMLLKVRFFVDSIASAPITFQSVRHDRVPFACCSQNNPTPHLDFDSPVLRQGSKLLDESLVAHQVLWFQRPLPKSFL